MPKERGSYQIKAVEDICAVAQYFPSQPAAHDEEGDAHGQQFYAEGEGLFLQLGNGLDELSTMPTAEATTMGGRERIMTRYRARTAYSMASSMKLLPAGTHSRILFTGCTLISGVIS